MEVAEEEEGLLERATPRRIEKEGNLIGRGRPVKGCVIGLEVAEEGGDMGGEIVEGSGRGGEGATEPGEELVPQGVKPVPVVALETAGRFLEREQS